MKRLNSRSAVRGALFAAMMLFAVSANAGPYAALVIEPDSNRVLYEKHADSLRHPASLTKMMTLYLVFEALDDGRLSLDTSIHFSRNAVSSPPTKLGLGAGESITVRQAILALVTHSANDAAVAVAETLGGSEADFARLMTQKAGKLGMTKTVFRNASGLPDSQQVTTAWDTARLAMALQDRFPHYYHFFSAPNFEFRNRVYRNHNHLVANYAGTDGIKTGFIRASGFNLVASTKRGDRRLIGVVFGGDSAAKRDAHMCKLLEDGFAQLNVSVGSVKTAEAKTLDVLSPVQLVDEVKSSSDDAMEIEEAPHRRAVTGASLVPFSGEAKDRYTGSSWKVRLGTFSRQEAAQQSISQAKKTAPSIFSRARLTITPYSEEGKKVYVAYLTGLSFDEATSGCRILKSKKLECLPVYSTS